MNIQRLFVDEAGDPILFNAKGRVLVGTEGCSEYFMIGKLDVEDPDSIGHILTELRHELLADPYFDGIRSFVLEKKKTALMFHAKDDVPEVRYRVFSLLRSLGSKLRFHAVVWDKTHLLNVVTARRQQDPNYRYDPDSIYDALLTSLFSKLHSDAGRYEVCVAKRGKRDRNAAIQLALRHAETDFQNNYGYRRGTWSVEISNPVTTVCLQAVDYYLWALQRFYEVRKVPTTGEEIREDRFLKLIWPQVEDIHDPHFGPGEGTTFTSSNPLTVEARFGVQEAKSR